jgi:hypothetical protein
LKPDGGLLWLAAKTPFIVWSSSRKLYGGDFSAEVLYREVIEKLD